MIYRINQSKRVNREIASAPVKSVREWRGSSAGITGVTSPCGKRYASISWLCTPFSWTTECSQKSRVSHP
jgi:hypothetical protein